MKINRFKVLKRVTAVFFITVVLLMLVMPFYIFQRFNAEIPIARLAFTRLADQQYIVELNAADFCEKKHFLINGDQWRLDASFLKWNGLGIIMGLDSRYQLDRLSGRYRKVSEQNNGLTMAYDLSPGYWLDVLEHKDLIGTLVPLVDAVFGSSVYLDINTDHIYHVYRSEDALIAKSVERQAVVYEKGVATIEINHACAKEAGTIARLVEAGKKLFNNI